MSDPVHVLKSRIGNLRKHLPDAKLSLYAMCDRSFQTFCMVGVAACAEQMLDLCHEAGLRDWTLGNTNCRSIIRNVDEEGPRLLTVVALKNGNGKAKVIPDEAQPAEILSKKHNTTSAERTRLRKLRRQRAKARARAADARAGETTP